MTKKKVLIIGSGGREHSIAEAMRMSPKVGEIFVAPGNGGTALMKNTTNVPIEAIDISGLAEFAESKKMGLTVVGPDKSLEFGVVDEFRNRDLRVFGPTRGAAKIEWSKVHSKKLMKRHNIPSAPFKVFDDYDEALKYVHGGECIMPKFIKADGLAQGKGALPCHNIPQAERILRELMVKKIHGDKAVVIEDFLEGPEASFHALCDGKTPTLFPPSQDYKLSHTGDEGSNTGGMGAFAPAPLYADAGLPWVKSGIIQPALHALSSTGNPFTGCLYPGVKITPEGTRVLEYNARFGDPECQVYMRLLKSDLYELLSACTDGELNGRTLKWHDGFAVCVVIASGGYPGKYETGFPIYGIEKADQVPGVVVFHAGTMLDEYGVLRTDRGRVLNVTAVGDNLEEARERAYEAINWIAFQGMHYRKDIAYSINSI